MSEIKKKKILRRKTEKTCVESVFIYFCIPLGIRAGW
jgi:hypothetical protein